MNLSVLREEGYDLAMFGLGLSYGLTSDTSFEVYLRNMDIRTRIDKVAQGLAFKDGGHNKFLESIQLWMDLDAPRYMWSEFDTYRVGISKQSESTMHTIKSRLLNQSDFETPITKEYLEYLNSLIAKSAEVDVIKNELPEWFLQRRIVSMNYKTLRNIYHQRKQHKLAVWRRFCADLMMQIEHPEFIHGMEQKANS